MQEKMPDKKDLRRQHIVTTARKAFFETGYGGTSMSAIAALLGGSKTTLWSYFPNKHELFSAVVDDLVDQYGKALRLPLPDDADLHEMLTVLARMLMVTLHQPEIIALHRMVSGEAARFPELGALLYERGPRRGHQRIGAWLSIQMDKGLVRRADPIMAAQHFAGLCQSGSFQRHLMGVFSRPEDEELIAEADVAVSVFLRAYAP